MWPYLETNCWLIRFREIFPQKYKEVLLSVIIGLTKLHVLYILQDTVIRNSLNGGYLYLTCTHLLISVSHNPPKQVRGGVLHYCISSVSSPTSSQSLLCAEVSCVRREDLVIVTRKLEHCCGVCRTSD
jgi:hypothetical protein